MKTAKSRGRPLSLTLLPFLAPNERASSLFLAAFYFEIRKSRPKGKGGKGTRGRGGGRGRRKEGLTPRPASHSRVATSQPASQPASQQVAVKRERTKEDVDIGQTSRAKVRSAVFLADLPPELFPLHWRRFLSISDIAKFKRKSIHSGGRQMGLLGPGKY